jgi:methyl-accepting chemotaxis protein/methyl-accepting chemotaxis protein-1 (serine sensor receptor)
MQNWTIGRKLFTGVSVMIGLIVVTAWLGVRNSADLSKRLGEAAGSIAKQIELGDNTELQSSMLYENGLEAIVAATQRDRARSDEVRKQTAGEVAELEKGLEALTQFLDSDADRQNVARIKAELAQWKTAFGHLQGLLDEGKLNEAVTFTDKDFRQATDALEKAAKTVADDQFAQLNESKKQADQAYTTSFAITIGAVIFSALTALVVVWVVRTINRALRQIVTELSDGAQQVAAAASQVSSSSQSLAQGSSEQAASIEETSASSEEINSMARKNAENSKTAAENMVEASTRVSEANRNLEQMVTSMNEINASSDKISKIIKVIDEIAFQTNILALNAAVEAARAGEAGMGFAVVADEVRNLAQRCAQAAKDTSGLIEESITKSNDGKTKLDQVATAVRSITDVAEKVKTLVDEVNLGSQEQARGIEQVSKAITQMEKVTQTTAANAEESASASEELSAQSDTLHGIVGRLSGMVGASGSRGAYESQQRHGRLAPHAIARPKPSLAPTKPVARLAHGHASADLRPAEPVAVASGKGGFPMDEDFKEF